ncbi:MAG: hypothetical protein B7Y87_04605 [Sphingomonadales bacterium 32-64-22]|nr:MAG: hypothetical protein B7Y87_04605 [Sphingomonadales bacterium 32-64-22]
MIVDLMRNDVSRVAVAGTVRVEKPFLVETYPTVHTMTTTVCAQLQPRLGAMDMIRALFPCGSITGAPKIRAMELIDETERDVRGPYCGAIGRIAANGDAAFNVAIRTIRLTPEENGRGTAVMGVGGAIVADSTAMSEWRECLVKADFVRQAAAGFDLIETMGFDPEKGIPLLEEPAKLRLLLARSGATTLETGPVPAPAAGPMRCALVPLPVVTGDWRLRHKSTDRAFYEMAFDLAKQAGANEALLLRDDGLITEGSFTNIFVERDGMLLTPPLRLGLLPGVLRRSLIDAGKAVEAELTVADLAEGFLLGNATRGLMAAQLMENGQ